MEKVLISSCLLGVPCRWHGRAVKPSKFVRNIIENEKVELYPVCPELLGGLLVPRKPVKRKNGKVWETCADKENRKNVTGKDVTASFEKGSTETLKIALENEIKKAILCKWSPSCDKNGFTGRVLIENEIEVINTW